MIKRLCLIVLAASLFTACAAKYQDPYQHSSQQQKRSGEAMKELERSTGGY